MFHLVSNKFHKNVSLLVKVEKSFWDSNQYKSQIIFIYIEKRDSYSKLI